MAWTATAEVPLGRPEADEGFEERPATVTERVVIGRQVVRDRESDVVGYELLTTELAVDADAGWADDEPVDADDQDDDPDDEDDDERPGYLAAAACTSTAGVMNLLVGGHRVFHRASRAMLLGEQRIGVPASRLVLEIGEEFNDDAEAVVGAQELAKSGFTLALADFPWAAPARQLLDAAGIVAIDTRGRSADELASLCQQLHQPGRTLLADKIETQDVLANVRGLGFDLFAGYALQHVHTGPHVDPGASQAGLARMSALLLSRPRDFDEIEDMLRTEPGLAYQVMELASIGRMGETARKVNSLRRALVLIGSWRIQTWMAMLLAHPHGQRTNGAMTGALARARACEMLAEPLGRSGASLGYTGGMISAFEELTQVPRDELQKTLALSDDLRDAAFGDHTDLGRIVTDVADRQEGRADPRRLSDRSPAEIDAALAAGYEWATRAGAAIA